MRNFRDMLFSATLYASLILLIVYWLVRQVISWWRYYSKVRILDRIPGPAGYALIGNALDLRVPFNTVYYRVLGGYKLSNKNGVVKLWMAQHPVVLLSEPSAVESVLSSSSHLDKSFLYKFLHPWLRTGLLTSTGKKWHSRRKLLTPAFHFRILEDFLQVMVEQSCTLMKLLDERATGEQFDMFPYITNCALDIICDSAMGCHVKAQTNEESDYVKSVYRMGYLIQERQRSPWIQPDFLFYLTNYYTKQEHDLAILKGFTKTVIEKRRANIENLKESLKENEKETSGVKSRMAFLDLLLLSKTQNGDALSNEDVQEEVDTFMFEGHDTTAAGINWCLFLLGLYPNIQEKCYQETQEIFENSSRNATSEDLRKMKYIECCIKEAQRLYPSVPFIGRELTEEAVIGGYKVPADTTVMINITALHQNPEVWPDPYIFNPDRFSVDNINNMHPYAFIPFSAGPRNCIGQRFAMMEEKVIVSSVIRRFRIESCDRRDSILINGALILRPEVGLNMRFYRREK